MTATKTYACAHCGEQFSNYVRRYQHVRDRHAEQRNQQPVTTLPGPASENSRKRETDTWPSRA